MASIIWASPTGRLSMVEFDCVGQEEHTITAEVSEHPVEEGIDITDHVRPRPITVQLTGCITNTPINSALTDTTYLETSARPVGLIVGQSAPLVLAAPEYARGGGGKQPGLTTTKVATTAQITNGWVSPHKFPGFPRPHGTPITVAGTRVSVPISGGVGGTSFQALTPQDRVRACFDALFDLCRVGKDVRLVTSVRDYEAMLITSISAPVAGFDSIDFSISLSEVRFATVVKGVPVTKRTAEKRAKTEESKGALGTGYKLSGDPDNGESILRDIAH